MKRESEKRDARADGENKNKDSLLGRILPFVLFAVIGAVIGFAAAPVLFSDGEAEGGAGNGLLYILCELAVVVLSIFAALVLHEAGHLLFGLLTGYGFCSFRIMSFIWVKDGEDGKIRLKRHSIAGTAGQCLMSPPDLKDGKMPFVLYNLGGVTVNGVTGLLAFLLYALLPHIYILSNAFLIFGIASAGLALSNGIPFRVGGIDNDGRNAVSLSRSPTAQRAFWVQMKVAAALAQDVRIGDLPDEWFVLPTDAEMKNPISAVVGVFACNRLMDQHRFDEADRLMEHILSIDSGISGLHRKLTVCDRIYCELIGACRASVVGAMMTDDVRAIFKSMKNFPSVLRTEYALALLLDGDAERANAVKQRFEKVAAKYPYKSDAEAEYSLIVEAERVFHARCG